MYNNLDYKEMVIKVCNEYYHSVEQENGLYYVVKGGKSWKKYSEIYQSEDFVFTEERDAWACCLYLALLDLF